MTTIIIDCRFAGTGTGLSRYTTELVTALLASAPSDVRYVLLVRSASAIQGVSFPHRIVVADIPHYSREEQTTLPSVLRSSNADLAFFPHFNAPFFCPLPYVATVHDLILHRHPGEASFLKRAAYRILIHRTLRRAAAIIAVSRWTKEDVAHVYGSTIGRKTTVIGEGVSDCYRRQDAEHIDSVRMKYGLHRSFFLYIGNCKPHKNVPMLLEAFERAQTTEELVIVTSESDARSLSLPANVRIIHQVPNDDMPALYSAAACFVTASLEEGYCLPIAEALACGCPVIATNRSAIPEILAGHGVLLEPTVEAFSAAFSHPPSRIEPVLVGSWAVAAEQTAALLRSVTCKKPR